MVAPRLAMLRRFAKGVQSDTCVIQRPADTFNDSGGRSQTWTNQPSVPCRIRAISSREALVGTEMVTQADGVALLPAGTDIRESDRIAVGSVTYEVSGVPVSATEEVARKVFVRITG